MQTCRDVHARCNWQGGELPLSDVWKFHRNCDSSCSRLPFRSARYPKQKKPAQYTTATWHSPGNSSTGTHNFRSL